MHLRLLSGFACGGRLFDPDATAAYNLWLIVMPKTVDGATLAVAIQVNVAN